jgi:hypothetical protein
LAGGGLLPAIAAASLLAVHPMMTEAVAYISARSELLCAAAFLGALLSARRWMSDSGGWPWIVATLALSIAAMAARETAAILPVVLIAANQLWTEGSTPIERRRRVGVLAPMLAATAIVGLGRVAFLAWVEYPGRVAIHWEHVPLALDVIRRYLILLAFPVGQAVFHEVDAIRPLDPRMLTTVVILGVLVAAAWRSRRTDSRVTLGIVWFLLALLPSSFLIVLDQGEPVAERRVYLASCGLFLAAGAAIGHLDERLRQSSLRRFLRPALAIVLLAFAAGTYVRNQIWSDPVALWREAAERAPAHYRPRLLLGAALQAAGRLDEASVQLQNALAPKPAESLGHLKLGESLAAIGRSDQSRHHAQEALRLDASSAAASRLLTALNGPLPLQPPDVDRR